MDNSVRGHKQLSKSIKQMKDNLLVNGYELVDMLGKDYHEGMKVTARVVINFCSLSVLTPGADTSAPICLEITCMSFISVDSL